MKLCRNTYTDVIRVCTASVECTLLIYLRAPAGAPKSKRKFEDECAKINRQLMKKGPSTYFHSHLVDGQDATNKISRQY
jgi:hypothetical protein